MGIFILSRQLNELVHFLHFRFYAAYPITESEIRTQTTSGKKKVKPVTGNMVWAEFIHLTSRPVEGGVPDPHLHAHCFTFNTTYDRAEKRWKATEFARIYHDAPYYQAAFQARFAKGLKSLGYGINRTEHAFEIAGIPESLIEKFCKRTKEIKKRGKELGITDPKLLDKLGAFTRNRKNLEYTKEELRAEWDKQFTPQESAAVQSIIANKGKDTKINQVTAKAAMDYALGHVFERASVIDHKRLLAEALHYGIGELVVEDILHEGNRPEILTREIEGNLRCTTKKVLAEERAMTAFARNSLNTCMPLAGIMRRHAIICGLWKNLLLPDFRSGPKASSFVVLNKESGMRGSLDKSQFHQRKCSSHHYRMAITEFLMSLLEMAPKNRRYLLRWIGHRHKRKKQTLK